MQFGDHVKFSGCKILKLEGAESFALLLGEVALVDELVVQEVVIQSLGGNLIHAFVVTCVSQV